MRKLVLPAAIAALLATSAIAFAATHSASGTVQSFDAKAMTLTLKNGTAYMLPKSFKDPGIKAGDKVSISWDTRNGSNVAEKVRILK
jgi:Cu/Ag efflux protein CusF